MSITGFIYGRYRQLAGAWLKRRLLRQPGPVRIERADWAKSLQDPTAFYEDCFRYFNQHLPAELREHRAYFCRGEGGYFGEDAMHVMWYLLFREFKPAKFIEIGIYRGHTLSLAAVLSRLNGVPCEVHGISPFSPAGDSVSKYRGDVDYLKDTLANFKYFSLPEPSLLKAYSTDPEAVALIRSKRWNMMYIDGNHDYEVARQDWEVCSQSVADGGIIVLDDSGLGTSYQPPMFATGGHPGPSRIAREIDRKKFTEVLQVGHNRVFQKTA